MAKCKYPNEVCANMTVLNGNTYCDSATCSLKNELPKQTNADRIRAMSDEELDEFLAKYGMCELCEYNGKNCPESRCEHGYMKWLQSEAE